MNLTDEEWTEYERERMAEQDYRGGLSLAMRRAAAAAAVASTAEAILTVLAARGLPVSDALRERVLATEDRDTLVRWVSRAATIASADELTG